VLVNKSRGKEYVQVVKYRFDGEKRKRLLLKAFGPNEMENILKAHLFADCYNTLYTMSLKMRGTAKWNDFKTVATATYGYILGTETLKRVLK